MEIKFPPSSSTSEIHFADFSVISKISIVDTEGNNTVIPSSLEQEEKQNLKKELETEV